MFEANVKPFCIYYLVQLNIKKAPGHNKCYSVYYILSTNIQEKTYDYENSCQIIIVEVMFWCDKCHNQNTVKFARTNSNWCVIENKRHNLGKPKLEIFVSILVILPLKKPRWIQLQINTCWSILNYSTKTRETESQYGLISSMSRYE